jgi:Mg2+ and Co2+ transporter CorA
MKQRLITTIMKNLGGKIMNDGMDVLGVLSAMAVILWIINFIIELI